MKTTEEGERKEGCREGGEQRGEEGGLKGRAWRDRGEE